MFILQRLIDHTYLAADCTKQQVDQLCQQAEQFGFAAVCVPPIYVARAVRNLQNSKVDVATVIAFPFGYAETPIKVQEIRRAIDEGADELDVVINLAAVKSGDWAYVRNDLSQVTTAARLKGKVIKLIIEIGSLTAGERDQVVAICNEVHPTFVKTSTGTREKATVEDVAYLRANLNPEIKIKASGGIRTPAAARALVAAGADRLGTSAGPALVQ